jgi:hypothetical protein
MFQSLISLETHASLNSQWLPQSTANLNEIPIIDCKVSQRKSTICSKERN